MVSECDYGDSAELVPRDLHRALLLKKQNLDMQDHEIDEFGEADELQAKMQRAFMLSSLENMVWTDFQEWQNSDVHYGNGNKEHIPNFMLWLDARDKGKGR
mmetsp:Transcript_46662/g.123841  ORF Transcript_46662/g.123841 Transcript_46662/m.123841 type:complete len:101 (-) Transcript_46662:431-733(-)